MMMMHPDHHDFIMRLCGAVAIVVICIFAFRLGRDVFLILQTEMP
jgi:hypothetical protein